jgi:asparagine synthase (glutamine-hydrolysing)
VIVHLYEDEGLEALDRLEGMFGLALIDVARRRLLLARDKMGMKPLYYAHTPGGMLFASEARALLATGRIKAAPDHEALGIYLTTGYVPAPWSAFNGVRRLQAGTYAVVQNGQFWQKTYWTPQYRSPVSAADETEYVERLEHTLRASVSTHMDAETPLGLFLSGGWDSSLVSLYAAQQSGRQLKTFSIVFPENAESDESRYSRQVAAQIRSDHCEVEIRRRQLTEVLPDTVRAVEEPCTASPSPLLYLLAQTAGRHVKGVLGGEGSDELFAGYLHYLPQSVYSLRRWVPSFMVRPFADLAPNACRRRKLRMLSAADDQAVHREWLWIFPRGRLRRLVAPELLPGPDIDELLRVPAATWNSCTDRLQQRLSLELTGRLPEALLLVNDKVTMAHSLELRLPLLDASVVDFALALPSQLKQRSGQEKYIISRLAAALPAEVATRRKQGLQIPFVDFLASPTGAEFVRSILLDNGNGPPIFHRRQLEPWIDHALSRDVYELPYVWRLVMLRIWWDEFVSASSAPLPNAADATARAA